MTDGGNRRLAILTSGGDAPGMNAAIRAATLIATVGGWEVLGVSHGYQGLLDDDLAELTVAEVQPILRSGGTILSSARCLDFHRPEARDRARAVLASHGVEALVVIGGNGSLAGALALSDPAEAGEGAVRVAGIPASIDNDLALTSLSIGVDTAMNTIVEAIDKIADTASAHDRTFLVEVMGRESGYLALTSAIAAGADMVLFPEAGRTEEALVDSVIDVVQRVRERAQRSKRVIAIKAEGVETPIERIKQLVDERLTELGVHDGDIETRVTVLGHVVRGGRPSAFDRLLASRLANVAVRALDDGRTRFMASWMPPGSIPTDVCQPSPIDPFCYLVDLGAALAATDEFLRGESALAKWRAGLISQLEDVFLV